MAEQMEWGQGWAAEEEASFSSFNEGASSMPASFDQEVTNEVDSNGLNARLNAVADELADPRKHNVRDVLRDGEELYTEGVQLWDKEERERAGTAFLRSINLCQEALGDALDSMEEEELEALIALSEKQLALAREHGWATHDDDTGAGLPPAGPHTANATGIDPFSPNGGSYEDDYDQEEFEGSDNEYGYSDGESQRSGGGGIGFPITVSNSTGESGGDDGYRDDGGNDEIPWPPSLNQERGSSRSGERSRSTEPRLQGGGMTLGDGWQLTMEGGTSAFDERAFDDRQRFEDRVAYQPHSMYDSLRSSPSRSSVGNTSGHKANARAPFVYSDLSVVRMALGGPPPAAASLPPALAMGGLRPTERPSGAPNGSRRRGMLPPQGAASPLGETEIAVAHSVAAALERSVEELCPELTTPRRRGWDPVHPKRAGHANATVGQNKLRSTHGASWSLPNYQTRDNLRHPRSAVNGFRVGTPSALGRSLPRRAVRSPVNMYAESRPWRNSLSGGESMTVTDLSFGSTGSSGCADNRPVLFTMVDITRGAEAEARVKLQQRAEKMRRIEAINSPPRIQKSGSSSGGRQVSPQKQKAKLRLKQARENKARREAPEKQREDAETEDAPRDDGSEPPEGLDLEGGEESFIKLPKTGSFSMQWNDKLERTLVHEKAQKARFLMEAGLNEEEHMKVKVSPQMNYLSRLSANAIRSYDEDACSVAPSLACSGAVALTDSGKSKVSSGGNTKKQAAAAAYAEKMQEILTRAREQTQSPRDDAPGSPKAQTPRTEVVTLTMTESSELLEQHPGAAETGAAFARIDDCFKVMVMVNRSTLLTSWVSEDVKQKAGNSGWNMWRPANGMIGEILQRWDWHQGVWLLKIAGQPGGVGEGGMVDRYCVMPKTACASVKVLGMRSISMGDSGEDSDEEEREEGSRPSRSTSRSTRPIDETNDSKRAIEPVPH